MPHVDTGTHFGDVADGRRHAAFAIFAIRPAVWRSAFEPRRIRNGSCRGVLEALRSGDQRSTGKLHTEVCADTLRGVTRDNFEDVLGAMARAGLARLAGAVFEKDGKQIAYRTARLTEEGKTADPGAVEIVMKDISALSSGKKRKKKARPSKQSGRASKKGVTESAAGVEKALRSWRMAEAKRAGVPAFRVFSDRTLLAIVETLPTTPEEFLAVPGIGLRSVEKYRAAYLSNLPETLSQQGCGQAA